MIMLISNKNTIALYQSYRTDLVGVEGFEPSEWMSQSHLPYHLATPQYLVGIDGFEPSE